MILRCCALWLFMSLLVSTAQARDVMIFAAASLANAMQDISTAYRDKSGHAIKLVLAGSSTLARQIEAGARADIFLSADEGWMDYLEGRQLISTPTRQSLLSNDLVLIVPADDSRVVTFDQGRDWLEKLGHGRIAVGDPSHVPVGRYARAALQKLGVWSSIRPRLATALDTRGALALVVRGEAIAGITYATDAAASRKVRIAAKFPSASHPVISYPIARLATAGGKPARQAFQFFTGSAAREIFKRHGFRPL